MTHPVDPDRPSVVEAVDDLRGDVLDAVVAIHRGAFPDSALSILGDDMTRRYYRSLYDGPHEPVGLIARAEGGTILGFLVGGTFRGSTIGFLSTQRGRLAGAVLRNPRALVSPIVWGRVRDGLRLLWARRGDGPPVPEEPAAVPPASFGVLSVAVDPATQRGGVGRALIEVAVTEARAHGFASVHLTADPASDAVPFYEALGFERRLEPDGRWQGRFHLDLDGAGRGAGTAGGDGESP